MGTVLIILLGVLVLAGLLYLGREANERRKLERQRQLAKAEAEAEGHRSMAETHTEKAAELADAAEAEVDRAARHEARADDVDPQASSRD